MRYRREAFEAVCVPFLDQATQVESSGYANAAICLALTFVEGV
jgi:hypothetical protein